MQTRPPFSSSRPNLLRHFSRFRPEARVPLVLTSLAEGPTLRVLDAPGPRSSEVRRKRSGRPPELRELEPVR